MTGKKLTRGRYLRGAERTTATNGEPRRRSWVSLWALAAVLAVASAYGVATARALESGATVQVLIPFDVNPDFYYEPEDFLVYHQASETIDARGCALGDKPVQSATLVEHRRHVGNPAGDPVGNPVGNPNPTVEVITTYQSGSHDVTTPVEPGTRVGNLLFVTVCSIFVGDTRVDYTKYTGTVK